MESVLSLVGGILAIVLYVPTLWYIWTGELKQSFATWILWVALDGIALGSMDAQGSENIFVLKCYITGGTCVWLSLLIKGQFEWTWIETCTVGLVFFCLAVWKVSGPYWATIASTTAVCISALPQLVKSNIEERDPITGYIYFGYGIVNILFFFAGKSWSVEDRFYAGMVIPLCFVITYAAFKRREPIPLFARQLWMPTRSYRYMYKFG